MELTQQNSPDNAYLQNCTEITTGRMTECVSIILLCNDNSAFGIHCGGGITGGWDDKIIDLFRETGKTCDKIIAVFGQTYQSGTELVYLSNKIDAVKKIGVDLNVRELEIYSSDNFTYNVITGGIQGSVKKLSEKEDAWVQLHV